MHFNVTMVTKVLSLLALLFSSEALLYHISSDPVANETCTVNGSATLTPCYSLQQLCEDKTLLSNKTQLTLLLLPGTHVIPQGHTLLAYDVEKLEISPWNGHLDVIVQCQRLANLTCKDIGDLKVSYIEFKSCFVIYDDSEGRTTVSIEIVSCIFAENVESIALSISNPNRFSIATVSIKNCTFSLNHGGLLCNANPPPSQSRINSFVYITDTKFLGNGNSSALSIDFVNLTLRRCHFINNTARSGGAIFYNRSKLQIIDTVFECNRAIVGRGGAINSPDKSGSILTLNNSTFLGNTANESGGATSSNHNGVYIYNSQFHRNTATEGGAIFSYSFQPFSKFFRVRNSNFSDNYASKSGGAIACVTSVNIAHSHFSKNVAKYNGGAISCRKWFVAVEVINTTFKENVAMKSGGAIWSYSIPSARSHGFTLAFCHFENNYGQLSGGAIHLYKSTHFILKGSNTFKYNHAGFGGAIYCGINAHIEFGYI